MRNTFRKSLIGMAVTAFALASPACRAAYAEYGYVCHLSLTGPPGACAFKPSGGLPTGTLDMVGAAIGFSDVPPRAAVGWSAEADAGALGIRGSVEALGTPATSPYGSLSVELGYGEAVTAVSRSGVLANGSPVPVTLTLRVHGIDTYVGSTSYSAVRGRVSVEAGAGAAGARIDHDFDPSVSTTTVFDQTVTAPAIFEIGDPVSLFSQLLEDVGAGLQPGGSDRASITLDYLDGVDLFLTASDPDILLVATSGHDYSLPLATTAVPEPATILLLALPAAVLVASRRRRFNAAVVDTH